MRLQTFVESAWLKLLTRVFVPALMSAVVGGAVWFFNRGVSEFDLLSKQTHKLGDTVVNLDSKLSLEVQALKSSIAALDREGDLQRLPIERELADHETRIRQLERPTIR